MKIFKPLTVFVLAVFCYSLFAASAPGSSYTGEDQVKDSKQTSTRPDMYNRVHRAGLFWLNVTNRGYFGNPSSESKDPCTGKTAVSGELPGGSGTDFLFVGSLLFGGYLNNGEGTNGGTTFIGPLVSTGYEGWTGEGSDDMAKRALAGTNYRSDPSGRTLGKINRIFECGRQNKLSVRRGLRSAGDCGRAVLRNVHGQICGQDIYRKGRFRQKGSSPLGIEIRQKSYAWSYDYAQKFVIIDYTLYNRNEDAKDIYNFFMGVYLDCDIGHTSGTSPSGGQITANHGDDIGGFIQKWDKYIDPPRTSRKQLTLTWHGQLTMTAEIISELTIRKENQEPENLWTELLRSQQSGFLRNPNPNLRYAFNMYVADDS
jgi:hypothetical protein